MTSTNYLLMCIVPFAVVFIVGFILVFSMCKVSSQADAQAKKAFDELQKGSEQ